MFSKSTTLEQSGWFFYFYFLQKPANCLWAVILLDMPDVLAGIQVNSFDVAVVHADSILLPTLSSTVRVTADAKADYFTHFLEKRPVDKIDQRHILVECNTAIEPGCIPSLSKMGQLRKRATPSHTERPGKIG